jgi:hypothetical protein
MMAVVATALNATEMCEFSQSIARRRAEEKAQSVGKVRYNLPGAKFNFDRALAPSLPVRRLVHLEQEGIRRTSRTGCSRARNRPPLASNGEPCDDFTQVDARWPLGKSGHEFPWLR